MPDHCGIFFRVSREKAEKWISIIDEALTLDRLWSGDAQKLAGKLMWATQHLFFRCECAGLRFMRALSLVATTFSVAASAGQ